MRLRWHLLLLILLAALPVLALQVAYEYRQREARRAAIAEEVTAHAQVVAALRRPAAPDRVMSRTRPCARSWAGASRPWGSPASPPIGSAGGQLGRSGGRRATARSRAVRRPWRRWSGSTAAGGGFRRLLEEA